MKGEIIKCAVCGKTRVSKTNGNTPKYCSIHCRNVVAYHERGGADYQREYLARRRSETYNKKELIKCELCGKFFRQVGSHVYMTHGILARDYREALGFDVKRGQLPVDLKELYAAQVFENGTVENLKKGEVHWFKKGQEGVGIYKRSNQTIARLKHIKK